MANTVGPTVQQPNQHRSSINHAPCRARVLTTPPRRSYVILAPTRVRAGQEITVRALVTRLDYSQLTIRTSVLRNGEELTFARETFHAPSRRFIKMKVKREDEMLRIVA